MAKFSEIEKEFKLLKQKTPTWKKKIQTLEGEVQGLKENIQSEVHKAVGSILEKIECDISADISAAFKKWK